MGLSAVTSQPALAAVQSVGGPAGARPQATLSEQDQAALIAARPAALQSAAVAAANLTSPDGSASGRGSVDTYL